MTDIKLPNISADDIEKLDDIFNFLKDNRNDFINIATYGEQKWGENDTLYLTIAKCIRQNDLTINKKNGDGGEYIWSQMINSEGLAFDGFKKEYERQKKSQKKDSSDKSWDRFNKRLDGISKPFLILSLFATISWNFYQLYQTQKKDMTLISRDKTIDSLKTVIKNTAIVN
jgi:hypothetical protein